MKKISLFLTIVSIVAIGSWYYSHKTMTKQNDSLETSIIKNKENVPFPEENGMTYFNIPMGNDWVAINSNWSIRLAEVLSDNRCPIGVTCATAGKAKVKVQFTQPNVD